MTSTATPEPVVTTPATAAGLPPAVEIVVPVYNEAATLDASVARLRSFLDHQFPFTAVVTVVDNASTDGTWAAATDLAARHRGVRAVRLEQKGRGRAIRTVWAASDASVLAYMDVDLSTDLAALLPLVAPLLSGHSDVAIGTRLARGSRVVRGPKREVLSRGYNLLLRTVLGNTFSDAQCGFKAVRSDVARELLPTVVDNAWFFDTELLVQAERAGLRIHEVPVDWVDDPDSRVDIARTVTDDLRGVWRMLRQAPPPAAGQTGEAAGRWSELLRFAGVGAASTVADLVLFLLLRDPLGPYGANALALGVCTLANLAAHRRLTASHGPMGLRTAGAAGLLSYAASLAVSTAALAVAGLAAPGAVGAEVLALLLASGAVAAGRFLLLRAVAFHRHQRNLAVPGAAR